MRFFIVLNFFCLQLFANTVFEFKGQAKLKDGSIAYDETHKITFNDDKNILLTETTYFKDGKKIAYLYNNYEKHPYVPIHYIEDYRFDYTYGIKMKGKKAIMYKEDKGNKESEGIDLEDNSISSQGFNTYLSSKLDKIKDGEVFDFILPGKMTRVDFKVKKNKNNKTFRFTLEADSFFIRLLAPKMTIEYSDDGRIRYYKGPSNLPDAKEESQNVTITYQYPDEVK